MKKLISFILVFACIFTTGFVFGTTSLPIETGVVAETEIVEASDINTKVTIKAKPTLEDEIIVEETVTSELKTEEIAKPTVAAEPKVEHVWRPDSEYTIEFCQAFIAGDYEFNTGDMPQDVVWRKSINDLHSYLSIYNTKFYSILNLAHFVAYNKDGKYYLWTNNTTPYYTKEELSDIDNQARIFAKQVVEELHDDSLTEYEQAFKYLNYMYSLNVRRPNLDGQNIGYQERNNRTLYNTPYAVFINKCPNCNGSVAAFNLLMEYDGITCYGLHVSNHLVSYLVLDGEEYFCDWVNYIGIKPLEEITNYFAIDDNYNLEDIRKLL